MNKILVIPDLHFPFHITRTIKVLTKLKKVLKPDVVIQLGDLVDQYCFSAFGKDPEAYNASQELDQALIELRRLFALFPNLKLCFGNHCVRLFKRAAEGGIPSRFIRSYVDLLEVPETVEISSHFVIDDIRFFHGDGLSGRNAEIKLIEQFRQNCVIGHLHSSAGIKYLNNGDKVIWAATVGGLLDQNCYAALYGKHFKDKPLHFVLFIEDGIPHLIPV
jgi:predicted phosphodiesterase